MFCYHYLAALVMMSARFQRYCSWGTRQMCQCVCDQGKDRVIYTVFTYFHRHICWYNGKFTDLTNHVVVILYLKSKAQKIHRFPFGKANKTCITIYSKNFLLYCIACKQWCKITKISTLPINVDSSLKFVNWHSITYYILYNKMASWHVSSVYK